MSLTLGTAVFGPKSNGRFNFEPADQALYWEDFPKRVRAELGGQTIADSRRVKALFETGRMMVFYFPREDVRMDMLQATDRRTHCPLKGEASYWTIRAGDRSAQNAAWAYEEPIDSARYLSGHLAFDYEAIDAWYHELDRVYAHPRDPYHRFDIHHSDRAAKVHHGPTVIAQTTSPRILFETGLPPRFYFPPSAVKAELLEKSETISHCPYKGAAQHWHVHAGGERIEDAAWSLPDPLGEAEMVRDWLSFYPRKLSLEADGEKVTA